MVFPDIPNAHAASVLVLTVVALYLFTRERVLLQTSSLAVLALLCVGFELFPFSIGEHRLEAIEFFHGFGHEALVAVCGLMIAGQGLVRTGALVPIGRSLARLWGVSPSISLLLTLVIGGILSAFVNNTPIVVLLLPILTSVSLRTGTSTSGVLMPMGFATLVGGMSTTIGTSTNLLVVAIAADLGLRRFDMFDFFVPAIAAGGIGILYLWLIAPRLLPEREAMLSDDSPRVFSARLLILEDSFADGKTLSQAISKTDNAMKVKRIRRGEDAHQVAPLPDVVLCAGDQLVVQDTPRQLKEYEQVLGATLHDGETPVDSENPLTDGDQQIAEIVVTEASPLNGRALRYSRFMDQFQFVVVALHRAGKAFPASGKDLADIALRTGDVLLVQGPREQLGELKQNSEVLVLDATTDLPHTARAPLALIIMVVTIACAALGILPISVAAVCGALLMILTGCLSWSDATQALSAQVILIVVASLALGAALQHTGGTQYLADIFLWVTDGASRAVILSGLMLLMAVLTNIVSNNAAAVIGTPIAVSIANHLGVPPEPYVLAVLFGANMSYATPMAYKTNLLVMNAGGYTFADFVRIGVPLTIIVWLALSLFLPVFYGI